MKRFAFAIFVGHLLIGVAIPAFGQVEPTKFFGPLSVSQLIATPEKYASARVLVTGYCRLLYEGTAIYAYKEDFEKNLSNQIWLDMREDQLTKANRKIGYCVVEGLYDPSVKGHLGVYVGTITDIKRFEPLPPNSGRRHR